ERGPRRAPLWRRAGAPLAAPPPAAPCARRWRGTPDRSGGLASRAASSPEERAPGGEAVGEPGGDAPLHTRDLPGEDLVLVVGIALEAHWLAEVDVVLHGKRDQPQQAQPRPGERHRERGHAEKLAQPTQVGDGGRLLLGADDRDRHDGAV